MTTIKIIGIGSPFGADSIAWQVIDSLKLNHALQTLSDNRITFINCDRPGIMLVDYIQGADCVILVDALEGGSPGSVRELDKQQLLGLLSQPQQVAEPGAPLSSHDFGMTQALHLANRMNMLPEKLYLIAIEIGDPAANFQFKAMDVQGISNWIVNNINDYRQLL